MNAVFLVFQIMKTLPLWLGTERCVRSKQSRSNSIQRYSFWIRRCKETRRWKSLAHWINDRWGSKTFLVRINKPILRAGSFSRHRKQIIRRSHSHRQSSKNYESSVWRRWWWNHFNCTVESNTLHQARRIGWPVAWYLCWTSEAFGSRHTGTIRFLQHAWPCAVPDVKHVRILHVPMACRFSWCCINNTWSICGIRLGTGNCLTRAYCPRNFASDY